jgi:hypothetical protein
MITSCCGCRTCWNLVEIAQSEGDARLSQGRVSDEMSTEIDVAEAAGEVEVEVEVDYGQAVQMELVATWWHWLDQGQKAGNHQNHTKS